MVLQVKGLSTSFKQGQRRLTVIDRVSFKVNAGETLGVVGESGCGKSITALSIMRLLPKPAGHIDTGEVIFNGQDLMQLSTDDMHNVRGNQIAMIFQEPMTALNPVHRIGKQLEEVWRLHHPNMNRYDRNKAAIESLTEVGIPEAQRRLSEYPHQLSGGMRQRVMIAMALSLNPQLLIADEPTTALDVTIQAQILELIKQLQERHGTAVIFITHDLGVIAEICDQVAVMYAGRIAEITDVNSLFSRPSHPYSRGLLDAIPKLDGSPKTLLNPIPGTVPTIDQLGSACRFVERCSYAQQRCKEQQPPLQDVAPGQATACFYPLEKTSE
jgi:oligopeptide/dipeptide ABC transporter ATP-binding protein